jgi:hypothetical protein
MGHNRATIPGNRSRLRIRQRRHICVLRFRPTIDLLRTSNVFSKGFDSLLELSALTGTCPSDAARPLYQCVFILQFYSQQRTRQARKSTQNVSRSRGFMLLARGNESVLAAFVVGQIYITCDQSVSRNSVRVGPARCLRVGNHFEHAIFVQEGSALGR